MTREERIDWMVEAFLMDRGAASDIVDNEDWEARQMAEDPGCRCPNRE